MKTKIKIVLLSILCCPIISQAQVSPNVIKQFPAHIIYKIDDVISKVSLTEDKQIKIGKKLFTADSLANISLTKGEPVAKLKSYYTINTSFLKPILSAEELDSYNYAINKDNRFLVALKFATQLKLSKTQLNVIRQQNEYLDSLPKPTTKETIAFYDTKLNYILQKEQYISLLKIIYKEQSSSDAKKDWDKIKQLKLVADEKNDKEYNQIENYHLIKNVFIDPKAEKYNKKTLEALTNKIALQEPPVLIRAHILSDGLYKKNSYSSIIKYEKELQLTKIQIDTLLSKYTQLELIRFENEERDLTSKLPVKEPSEYANIALILSLEQVNTWLVNKNQQQAVKVAAKNWKKLEMEGLIKDLDKEATLTIFVNYQLNYQVTDEKTKIYNTQEYIFLKRDIELKKPDLLKQLDSIARSNSKNIKTKNALAW